MERNSFTLVMLTIAGSMALALGFLGIFGKHARGWLATRRESNS